MDHVIQSVNHPPVYQFIDRNGKYVSKDVLDRMTSLHRCIIDGRIAESDCLRQVKTLLQDGVDINKQCYVSDTFHPGYGYQTPLMTACQYSFPSVISYLLDNRADVNMVDDMRTSTLHYIVRNEHEDIIPVIIRIINTGININITGIMGATPLMQTCHHGLSSTVSCLLDHGADVNLVDQFKESALHHIVYNQHEDIIPVIIRIINTGINIDITDKWSQTPLMTACKYGLPSTVSWLLDNGADVNLVDDVRTSTLHYIVQNKHEYIIPVVICIINTGINININITDNWNKTPLMIACQYGLPSTVSWLLDHGADVNLVDNNKQSTLHYIVRNTHEDIIPVIVIIINTGIDINITDDGGRTPLMFAYQHGLPSTVSCLLDHGADANLVDNHKQSSLHYIGRYTHENIVPVIIRTINTGIDINITDDVNLVDNSEQSTLYYKVQNEHEDTIVRIINTGIDINITDDKGNTPLMIACRYKLISTISCLLEAGCNVILSNPAGLNILYVLAQTKNTYIISLLIKYGVDVLTQHPDNKLQLVDFILSRNDLDSLVFLLQSGLYVKTLTHTKENILHLYAKIYFDYSSFNFDKLLYFEPNINGSNDIGNTPLLIAAFLNNKPFLKFLVKHTSNINDQNDKGHTALHMCIIGFSFIKDKLNNRFINDDVEQLCKSHYYPVYMQCIDFLLVAGADVNIQDNGGKTILMLAAKKNDRGLVCRLLDYKANISIRDARGRSALQHVDLNGNVYNLNCFKLFLSNGEFDLLNLQCQNANTIIQSAMLFPALWQAEETCSFIRFLVAHNVSMNKLESVCGDSYYNQIPLTQFSNDQRTTFREFIYLSGASVTGIVKTMNFDLSDNNKLNVSSTFSLFCNRISLQEQCRRCIRQRLGFGIKKKIPELGLPIKFQDFLLLKDILDDKYFTLDVLNEDVCDGDEVNYDTYDLDGNDEDCQNYDITHYNLLSCYHESTERRIRREQEEVRRRMLYDERTEIQDD